MLIAVTSTSVLCVWCAALPSKLIGASPSEPHIVVISITFSCPTQYTSDAHARSRDARDSIR